MTMRVFGYPHLSLMVFPVFRIFLQHPYKYLNINNNILILGVAKLLLCLSEK